MQIDHVWGVEPKVLQRNEARQEAKESSSVTCELGTELLIEVHGPLAAIPSMKNSKLPGKNFMSNDYKARILALLALIEPELEGFSFGDTFVHMILISAGQGDLDGVCATVKDMLEPRTKQVGKGKNKRDRGWGLGVINDDSRMSHEEYYSWQIPDHDPNVTSIHLRVWDL